MSGFDQGISNQKAWVVFSGQTEISWLKWLKPGFRHCFILLNDGQRWVTIDPLSPYTDILVHHHVPADFDLPSWLEQRDLKIIPAHIDKDHKKPAPFMLFTCVEAVKRILGIHKRLILTPWQLYCHLRNTPSYQKGEISWAA